tara:strand:- start:2760 stop:3008 length:249 start_codon:yes stop_codon:yes gene_type:complete
MTEYTEMIEQKRLEIAADKWGKEMYQIEADGWKQRTTYYYNSGIKEVKNWETGKTKTLYPDNYTSPYFLRDLIHRMRRRANG